MLHLAICVRVLARGSCIFLLAFSTALTSPVVAQSLSFAGNAQHTANYPAAAQRLSALRWSASVDLSNSGDSVHYGEPLITASNTVIVPVRISTSNTFQINAYDGASGRLKYTVTNDFTAVASGGYIVSYQPVIASAGGGLSLCYAGPGGTVYELQNPDSDTPGPPVQYCFYTNLAGYMSNATDYKAAINIVTPLTTDSNGTVFFGFRVLGTAPAPISSTNCGFARVDAAGNGTWVLAGAAAGDSTVYRVCLNSAPALSGDGSTVYVIAKGTDTNGYILGLDATNLTTQFRAHLLDPRNNDGADLNDQGTASPMVGPDGDVFQGVLGNPSAGDRGFLLHFSSNLQVLKTPGAFGWDYTAAIVPTNLYPGYTGSSPYLVFSKYNNYAGQGDGNGINKIALLDPNATQLDPHPSAAGLAEMRELLTVIGSTPDPMFGPPSFPHAVCEWCINTAAVSPSTQSVLAPSEDGLIYRWDFASNSIAEVFTLGAGVGEPYVPTCIGPDGGVYTLNGGEFFALGSLSNVDIAVYSSAADLRYAVVGQPVTFTAVVTNRNGSGPVPTGTVAFQDMFYRSLTAITNTLAAAVLLSNGVAFITTTALVADGTNNGCHFITALYSGDANYLAGASTLVQKMHAYATVTTLKPSAASNAVTFTATVSGGRSGSGAPTGFAAFYDGPTFLAQLPLNTSGVAAYVTTNFSAAPHAITATYTSDTLFASSSGSVLAVPFSLAKPAVSTNGVFGFSFSNSIGAAFTALGTPNVGQPRSNWSVLGPITEVRPGFFQFTGPQSTNHLWQFYSVRSP
jgi:uncharacterized repeat protein (TIGR01451 family)